ncbi:hypothetical protein L7F22_008381 [Adiantum nelumboides]|nr:hypothetical protein [Adiantum nelumboides]
MHSSHIPTLLARNAMLHTHLPFAHLLTHPGDTYGAFHRAQHYASQCMRTVAKRWLLDGSWDISDMDCTSLPGHVCHAFTLAFFFLRHGASYEDAVAVTLQKGGDTDTNAAIVGSLVGALHGSQSIPAFMKDPVFSFDCSIAGTRSGKRGQTRPMAYSTKQIDELLSGLLHHHNSGHGDENGSVIVHIH